MAEQLTLRGTLKGHNGWVTQIATTPMFPDMILSASRDKSIIIWKLTKVYLCQEISFGSGRIYSHESIDSLKDYEH